MADVLLVRGLRKSFESEALPLWALRGVDLELRSGEFVAVMGPSELFRRLHSGGQTILLVTHDERVAEAAERVVSMRDGRIHADVPEPLPSVPRT